MRALKEWSSVVRALEEGTQSVILRKGGIHDDEGGITFGSGTFALFPTHEHQDASAIKPDFRHYLGDGVPHGDSFNTVRSYATVIATSEVWPGPALDALSPMHIWSDDYVSKRAAWKPERPIWAALLRVHKAAESRVQTGPEHAGCKSWIDVGCELGGGEPALGDSEAASAREAFEVALAK